MRGTYERLFKLKGGGMTSICPHRKGIFVILITSSTEGRESCSRETVSICGLNFRKDPKLVSL